jgi:ATP-dependent exoDNAse (exonuclease V) beta subunit
MRQGMHGGYVECVFIQKKNREETTETEDEATQLLLTAEKINSLTSDFGYRLKDITILVRGHKDAVKIAQFLTSQEPEIPVLSAEALLYTRQQHIQLIIETLRFLMFPDSSLHYAGLLYRYAEWHQINVPQRTIFEDWNIYKNGISEEKGGTRNRSLLYQWLPFLKDDIREQLLSCNLTQLIRNIIIGLQLQDQQDIYLQQFQDVVFKFQGNQPGASIGEFIEWWESHEDKAAINMPEGPDAVQIITIHKSKGLEFPVVIIPYADWSLVESNKGQFLWVERNEPPYEQVKDLPILFNDSKDTHFHIDYLAETTLQIADALNMAYVAFTRAAEHLYVFSEIQKDEKKHTLSGASQIGHLLYQTLKAQQEGVWEGLTYHSGEKHPKEGKEKATHSKTITVDAPNLSLEAIIGMKPLGNYNDEQLLGNFIHDVLAQLTDLSQLEVTIRKVSIKTYAKSSIVATARERLIHCLQDAQLREWFSGEYESVSEHDIWWKGEAIRPDKILMKGDEAILLDFKTGKPEKKHEAQIKEYQEAITALGIQLNASYLVYISELGGVEMREVFLAS